MDLQELKTQWDAYDLKLDTIVRRDASRWRADHLDKADSRLRRLSRAVTVELAITAIGVLLLGSFIGDHFREARFLAPAILVHIFAIGLLIAGGRQLFAIKTIDYSAPIVDIQKRLENLRILRIRTTKWVFLLCPLLWTPFLVVALKGFLGVDAYAALDTTWLAVNVAFGVIVTLALVAISRRWTDRFARSPFFQRLMDDIAGRSLMDAERFLDTLSRFDKEESAA